MGSTLQQKLRRARVDVRRACEMLVSPTPQILDQCFVLLETTTRELAGCRPEPVGNQSALQEALQLHDVVRHAKTLLDRAFAFHQAWAQRLGAMTAGYTPHGEPAPVAGGSRLAVQG